LTSSAASFVATALTTDITEHPTREGKVYCCVVLDAFSRLVVGCSVESTQSTVLVTNALGMATNRREKAEGLVIYSDRGVQFTSWAFRRKVRDADSPPRWVPSAPPYDITVSVEPGPAQILVYGALHILSCRAAGEESDTPGPRRSKTRWHFWSATSSATTSRSVGRLGAFLLAKISVVFLGFGQDGVNQLVV
jgi:hypothetical protein